MHTLHEEGDFIRYGMTSKIVACSLYIVGVKKFRYDIWGDTVNTPSRMRSHPDLSGESRGEVGQVNISEATYALVREVKDVWEGTEVPTFTFTPGGKVQAKCKGELEMYFFHYRSCGYRHRRTSYFLAVKPRMRVRGA